MNVGIYSFCTSDLNPNIALYQNKVFNKFNLKINQYIEEPTVDLHQQHGRVINKIIEQSKEDYIIIFDIDCIPLKYDFYKKICEQISDNRTLSGARGSSGNGMRDYIHAGFFGFSKILYTECGSPSMDYFDGEYSGDTIQRFTDECIKLNRNIIYWEITNALDNVFYIPSKNEHFGHGTIYENLIYHQFQISCPLKFINSDKHIENQNTFIKKCEEVLLS
jgi:hypothetical protein